MFTTHRSFREFEATFELGKDFSMPSEAGNIEKGRQSRKDTRTLWDGC